MEEIISWNKLVLSVLKRIPGWKRTVVEYYAYIRHEVCVATMLPHRNRTAPCTESPAPVWYNIDICHRGRTVCYL